MYEPLVNQTIDTLFKKCAENHGLKTGDIPPDQAVQLDQIKEDLSKILNDYIENNRPADYCEIGMSSCSCGWSGKYPLSGCPRCSHSFVE